MTLVLLRNQYYASNRRKTTIFPVAWFANCVCEFPTGPGSIPDYQIVRSSSVTVHRKCLKFSEFVRPWKLSMPWKFQPGNKVAGTVIQGAKLLKFEL